MTNQTEHDLTPAETTTNTDDGGNAPQTYSVNVGPPGNMSKIQLDAGRNWTVGEAIAEAGRDADGMEIRVGGEIVPLNTPINGDQTILLVRPVRGNS